MDTIKLEINQIKNIRHGELELPIEKGIYCLTGLNGSGKSTVLTCLARTVFPSSLKRLHKGDFNQDSYVRFTYKGSITTFHPGKGNFITENTNPISFNGMYEGSIFYGTRFDDSFSVEKILDKLPDQDIVDAHNYVKTNLSYILHGDKEHYSNLQRFRVKGKYHLRNIPYFCTYNGIRVSQYRMSSGECLLISLLHFIDNTFINSETTRSSNNAPVLMMIDEIELALHPSAIKRLIKLLQDLCTQNPNLMVILTSHSPDILYEIDPSKLYMIDTDENGELTYTNPCYPAYAIRSVYVNNGFDDIILVEDDLAKKLVDYVIKKAGFNKSRLINVIPAGGWNEVLRLQKYMITNNILGIGTHIFSVLDGDVKDDVSRSSLNSLQHAFLPVPSIEKFMKKIIMNPSEKVEKNIRKKINDDFFQVKSLDEIYADSNLNNNVDSDGKNLYKALKSDLEARQINESQFIDGLCNALIDNLKMDEFTNNLKSLLQLR